MGAGASDLVKVAHIFKRTYTGRKMPENLKRKHPWLARISKSFNWTGANDHRYAIENSNPQGIGGTFTGAIANNTDGSAGDQFSAVRRKRYGKGSIDGEARLAARDDNGALLRLVTHEVDGHLNEHTDTIAHALFRDGTGARAQVLSVSSNDIVLKNQDDIRWFKKNMKLIASTSASGASPRSGTMKVAAVNYATSTVTADTIVAGTAANDYLFRNTEQSDTASGGAPPIDGMQLIIPASPTTFRGVSQAIDRERYAGWYINDPNTALEDNCAELITRINSYSGGVSEEMLLICHPKQALVVAKRQQSKVVYDGGGDKALIGFGTFKVLTPMGFITCMPDPDCVQTDFYVVTPDTWELKCLDQAPHIIMDDGKEFLRETDADAIEFRSRSMGNLFCYAPVLNGRGTLNAV